MTALASNWWIHLLQAFWQATVAGAILLLIVRLTRGASPRLRHALISLALLKFVLPPMLPLPTGIFSAAPPARAVWLDGSIAIAVLMLVHLGGVAFMLARIAAGGWRVRRMVRSAEAADGFLLTDEVTVPISTGRHILIPRALHATLTAAELADVLEHEREHQRRGDVRTGVLQSLVAALWWFHPLVHVLVREARDLREERCDDAVVSRRGDRAAYARTLLRAAAFVSGETPQPAAAVAESEHGLLRRIRRLASARYVPSRRPGLAALVVLLLAALILLPGARSAGRGPSIHLHFHGH